MKILKFKFSDPKNWDFSPVTFHDHINLFVGESGSGKTRLINVIFNIADFVSKNERFCAGVWEMEFTHKGKRFQWKYSGELREDDTPRITFEELIYLDSGEILISRTEDELKFKGTKAPKLSSYTSAINLFKEEDSIAGASDAMASIMRRNFFGDDLAIAVSYQPMQQQLFRKDIAIKLADIYSNSLTLSNKLFLLQQHFSDIFELIVENFKQIFPFISQISFKRAANLPIAGDAVVLVVTEKWVNEPVPLQDISSGMQKVLLILSDVVVSPPEVLYLIDEYENSLGVNAINFLPPFLAEYGKDKQFIITTHHPSLINAIPVDSWFVFNRKGLKVRIKQGQDLAEKYSRSKQERFIQLLNDPFFIEGVD